MTKKKARSKPLKDERKKELAQLALDIERGAVFTDQQCGSMDMVPMCFPILTFLKAKDLDDLKDKRLIYEYLSKAGPAGVNGKPMFFSCSFLDQQELDYVCEVQGKLRAAIKGVMKS